MLLHFEYVDPWLLIVTCQILYLKINLDKVKEAHLHGLKLIKEGILQQLEMANWTQLNLIKLSYGCIPLALQTHITLSLHSRMVCGTLPTKDIVVGSLI